MRWGDAGAGREYAPLDLSFELSFEPSTRGWPSLPDDAVEGGATEPLAALRDWERRQRLDAEQRGA